MVEISQYLRYDDQMSIQPNSLRSNFFTHFSWNSFNEIVHRYWSGSSLEKTGREISWFLLILNIFENSLRRREREGTGHSAWIHASATISHFRLSFLRFFFLQTWFGQDLFNLCRREENWRNLRKLISSFVKRLALMMSRKKIQKHGILWLKDFPNKIPKGPPQPQQSSHKIVIKMSPTSYLYISAENAISPTSTCRWYIFISSIPNG